MTPPQTFDKPGWYVYQLSVAATPAHEAVTTPCTDPAERLVLEVQPRLSSSVSADRVDPGTAITDRVTVEGLAAQPATVHAALYGPFPAREAVDCSGSPIWSGDQSVTGDGEFTTAPFTPTKPGFYVYRETLAPQSFVRAAQTDCADVAETTVVVSHPQLVTRVSAQQTQPGATITDTATVTGLGTLTATVRAELWGPFAARSAIACSGTPYWSGTFLAKGDGTYTTAPVHLDRAGYYVYQESITEGPANAAYTAPCAQTAETTFSKAAPKVTTMASAEVVLPNSSLSDRIVVSGLGKTAAAIDVQLFGPFATRAAVTCTGRRPFWQGRVYAQGDGELSSPGIRVEKVGFYTFREQLVGSPLVTATETACPLALETSLARPLIITGRGDVTHHVAVPGAGGLTPRRIQLPSLGIDAPVEPTGIDVRAGVLGVSPNIHRTGWWVDGAAPGAQAGSILIAGHVDSRKAGAGAFFRLHEAKPGDHIAVTTANGRTFSYRVVSVKSYLKRNLPADVYSLRGHARLVVVTCGGPFDAAKRHYRDNVVVTAVPAG
jgi:hypothetical protein